MPEPKLSPARQTFRRRHNMQFGAELTDAGVRFRLWAPHKQNVSLRLDGREEIYLLSPGEDGWHELLSREAGPGTLYSFVFPDGLTVPDPASRFQPQDVHGPSEVIDPEAYEWQDGDWAGRPWEECVAYEVHVGAFTPEGTFHAAIERLEHLVRLGVTAIEIMPVADFPGERNWGYDGVLPYAPDSSYGRPEDFKAFVDAAHGCGLMVFLDVVYNHFGPDGNYLPTYSPVFTEKHKTPWGAAVNFDAAGAEVIREFVVQNALYWITEYHLDGLRLDAVHAILDDGPTHILQELAERVRASAGRPVHLILENEENQARRLRRGTAGEPEEYTAQWNDDVHHVLHTAATGESAGYYAEYQGDTEKLGRALAEGFAFQGELMGYRGEHRGEASGALPPTAFVAFIQNHDQVGNRAFGDRITDSAAPEAVRAIAATYLLLPQIPMLFMGEEWAARQPFPFFAHFGPELADAVRNGRRQEFARFPEFQDPAARERIPDPIAPETFLSAKLGWDDLARPPHSGWLAWYRDILAVRHREIVPRLRGIERGGSAEVIGNQGVQVRWQGSGGWELGLAANLSRDTLSGFTPREGRMMWTEGSTEGDRLAPWTVVWSVRERG